MQNTEHIIIVHMLDITVAETSKYVTSCMCVYTWITAIIIIIIFVITWKKGPYKLIDIYEILTISIQVVQTKKGYSIWGRIYVPEHLWFLKDKFSPTSLVNTENKFFKRMSLLKKLALHEVIVFQCKWKDYLSILRINTISIVI